MRTQTIWHYYLYSVEINEGFDLFLHVIEIIEERREQTLLRGPSPRFLTFHRFDRVFLRSRVRLRDVRFSLGKSLKEVILIREVSGNSDADPDPTVFF